MMMSFYKVQAKTWKRLLILALGVTVYFLFVTFLLPLLTDPRLERLTQYHRLENWDLALNADIDIDGDGKIDGISNSGCVFLSSAPVDSISADQRCVTSLYGVSAMKDTIGQKFAPFPEPLADTTKTENERKLEHSYLGKDSDGTWKLYSRFEGRNYVAEIQNDVVSITEDNRLVRSIDEYLYLFSCFWFLFMLPLFPIIFLSSFINEATRILSPTGIYHDWNLQIAIILCLCASAIFFWKWKASPKGGT